MTHGTDVRTVSAKRDRFFTALVLTGLLGFFGALSTLIWVNVLPEKYFYDGEYIRSLLGTELKPTAAFDAFVNTAWVFALMGFTPETPREITGITVFVLAFIPIAAWFFAGLRKLQYWNVLLFGAWIAVASVYLGQLTKEVIALWFVSLILYTIGLRRPMAWMAFILPVFYAVGFRPYWLLIALFWVLIWWLSYRNWAFSINVIFFYASLMAVSIAHFLFRGEYLTDIRERLNEFRVGSDVAQSMLANFLPNKTIVHDVINWTISWILILFPVPVLRFFEPLQLAFFLLVTSTAISIYRVAINTRVAISMFTLSQQRRLRACITFMLAFTLVQAAFEPDYGSVLKHMTDLLPMIAYALFSAPRGTKYVS